MNWGERDGWFGEIEIRVGRYCLGISYMLYKERESGEMRMGMKMKMKMKVEVGNVCCRGEELHGDGIEEG